MKAFDVQLAKRDMIGPQNDLVVEMQVRPPEALPDDQRCPLVDAPRDPHEVYGREEPAGRGTSTHEEELPRHVVLHLRCLG